MLLTVALLAGSSTYSPMLLVWLFRKALEARYRASGGHFHVARDASDADLKKFYSALECDRSKDQLINENWY